MTTEAQPLPFSKRVETFGELQRAYIRYHLSQRSPSTIPPVQRLFKQFFTEWEDFPLNRITRPLIVNLLQAHSATPSHANKALVYLRAMFNWSMLVDLYDGPNPTLSIQRFRVRSRERFMNEAETRRFVEGLSKASPKLRAYLLVLVMTGARRSEARLMLWADLDLEAGHWIKSTSKSGHGQVVPLPSQLTTILASLSKTSQWVFPGMHGEAWSTSTVEKAWGLLRAKLGLNDVRLHDLRRTLASHMAIDGENLSVIQATLNHTSLQHTSVYARLGVGPVKNALQKQADKYLKSG